VGPKAGFRANRKNNAARRAAHSHQPQPANAAITKSRSDGPQHFIGKQA